MEGETEIKNHFDAYNTVPKLLYLVWWIFRMLTKKYTFKMRLLVVGRRILEMDCR